MTMAKADRNDLQTTLDFFNACELALESGKWSLRCPEDKWEDLDEDDEDRILIKKIKKSLVEEQGTEYIDSRILMYEFLKEKFAAASCNWRRVVWGADILIENVCDPMEDHLAFFPGFELFHVAPEQ
jgi:hypothetical protein